MKKDMVVYLKALSGDNLDTLEKIIEKQFKKFRQFYWLLRDHSDDIDSLEYKFKSDTQLFVSITFTSKSAAKKSLESINENMDQNCYTGEVEESSGKTIEVTITLDEDCHDSH